MAASKKGEDLSPSRRLQGIFNKLLLAIAGGAIGAVVTFFSGEIHAYLSYFFLGGNLSGDYVIQSLDYDDPNDRWVPASDTAKLMHGGTQIFGTLFSTTSDRTWRVFGYFRSPFMALAYETIDRAAIGTGTYTLKQDLPYVFWGYWIGVQCNLNTKERFLAQCPAIMYRKDHPEMVKTYAEHLSRECVTITLPSGPCPLHK